MPADYYELLGVERGSNAAEIKKAFRARARELHPDVNSHDPAAEEKFKQVAEAYEVLKDDETRAVYDRHGHEGLRSRGAEPHFQDFNVSDIFQAFFGGGGEGFGFGGSRSGPARGADIGVDVEITLAEVAAGTTREIEVDAVETCEHCHGNGAEPGTPIQTCEVCQGAGEIRSVTRTPFGQMVRAQACDRCSGSGKVPETPCEICGGVGRVNGRKSLTVDIPKGIEHGQQVRISGRGHAGAAGGPPGDLFVEVLVAADSRFERHGVDLLTRLDLTVTDAALGTTVAVETLDGPEDLAIEAATQPGSVLRIKGKGLPALRGRRTGDLHVLVNVMVPANLSAEQRSLLERFAEGANGENYPADRPHGGLFDRLRQAFRG